MSEYETGQKKLIVKVAGVSNASYELRLNLYHKTKNLRTQPKICSAIAKIPAGAFHGSFTKDFYFKFDADKAEIIFIPEKKSAKRDDID